MAKAPRLVAFTFLVASRALAVPPDVAALPLHDGDHGTRLTLGGKLLSGTERREYAGFVALTLPLDSYAAPQELAQAAAAPSSLEHEPPAAQEPQPESGPDEEPRAASPLAPLAFMLLARQTVSHALLSAGAARGRQELASLASRARSSAALPQLRLRAARSGDEAMRLAPTTEDPNRYTLDGGTDLLLEAAATWRLDRLLFADEEVALARLRLERDKNDAALVARTLARLFAWRRALAKREDRALEQDARLEAELDGWEAQAELDVSTDGWFSERLQALGLSASVELGAGDGQQGPNLLNAGRDVARNPKQSPRSPKAR